MRKLTVKNFSVIKEAELEFGKITVLIGPQSSGKSLLCKLAYFLGKELVELGVTSILNGNSWDEYLRDASKAFWSRFALGDGLVSQSTRVRFSSHDYQISISWGNDANLPIFEFGKRFRQQYELLLSGPRQTVPSASGAFIPGGINPSVRQEEVWIALNQILSDSVLDGVLYIPAGRAFFTNTTKGIAVLQNVGIDSITRGFAGQIQWDSRWKVGMLTSGRGVTDEINRRMTEISQGFVMMDSGVPRFLASDGRNLPLEVLSSGVQEMIPLFNVLEQLMFFREHGVEVAHAVYGPPRPEKPASSRPFLYLEEPEANVFPKTQYELVELFAWLASDPILDFSWVITTHSPYILSSFNNLIMAGQLAKERPELKDEVAKLVPGHFWIEDGSFKAYCIHDGVLKSILSKSGLIDGEYLDSVSDTIGNEFDSLLRLEYDHTEAS